MRSRFVLLCAWAFLAALLAGCGSGLILSGALDRVPSAVHSSIEALATPVADGQSTTSVRITLRNKYGFPIARLLPQYAAGGFRNTVLNNCSITNASGVSLCENSLSSGYAEKKDLLLVSPSRFTAGQAEFVSQSQGYNARKCGFDMNRNGVRGEAADCRVCNGVTNDPDGDGINEDMIYIDSASGSDSTGTGSAASPFRSVTHALTTADGPGDGAEDILCLSGTFSGGILPLQGGITSTYSLDSFLHPRNPLTLVGWDKDGDGIYPPLDLDDTAVFDGGNSTPWFWNDTVGLSYVEMAHFSLRNFGDTSTVGGGLVYLNAGGNREYFSFHDLEADGVNSGLVDNQVAYRYAFSGLINTGVVTHFAITNSQFTRLGGSFLTFYSDALDWTDLLVSSVSVAHNTARGDADHLYLHGFVNTRYENSRISVDESGWVPATDAFRALHLGTCVKNFTARNNLIENVSIALLTSMYDPPCSPASTIDDILFDRNRVLQSFGGAPAIFMVSAKLSGTLSNQLNTTEDLTFTNNYFISKNAVVEGCIGGLLGNDAGVNPGTITFAGNTCIGPWAGAGANFEGGGNNFPHQNFVLRNNIFSDRGASAYQVSLNYGPTGWLSNGNIFEGSSGWRWFFAPQASLAAWQAASGGDASSRVCTPTFVDSTARDYHLDLSDTCARNSGVNITAVAPVDWDGDSRSASSPDSGADELP